MWRIKMKKIFISITIISVMIVLVFAFAKYRVIVSAMISQSENKLAQIKGLNLVTDEKFKRDLLIFMDLNSKGDQRNLFYHISTRILKNMDVKTPDAYVKKLWENITDSVSPPEYLEILGFQVLEKNKYQIDVRLSMTSEGESYEMRIRYFFVNEKTGWKYDGYDSDFR